jgi:hypothetical protein
MRTLGIETKARGDSTTVTAALPDAEPAQLAS